MNPPPDSHQNTEKWHRTFPGEKEQVCEARRFVKAHLPDHHEAELITSELATNAIEHTRTGTPGGAFTVTVEHHSDGIAYIEIEDQGGPTAFGLPTPNREGGRGLYLVTALTTAWGAKGDAAGRTVWAELPPPAP